jgi:hypothetical protein
MKLALRETARFFGRLFLPLPAADSIPGLNRSLLCGPGAFIGASLDYVIAETR